jgi:hypothetical protein
MKLIFVSDSERLKKTVNVKSYTLFHFASFSKNLSRLNIRLGAGAIRLRKKIMRFLAASQHWNIMKFEVPKVLYKFILYTFVITLIN